MLRALLVAGVVALAFVPVSFAGSCPITNPCGGSPTPLPSGGAGVSLDVGSGTCYVITGADASPGSPLIYDHVNVYDGGRLYFLEDSGPSNTIDFRASSILVEQGGLLQAGSPTCPFGSQGGELRIGLWGAAQSFGVATTAGPQCKTESGQCYDAALENGMCCKGSDLSHPCTTACDAGQASGAGRADLNAYFEGYSPLNYDGVSGNATTGENFFGFKVIGVSYGGQLKLYGDKGATYGDVVSSPPTCELPSDYHSADAWSQMSKTSWARLRGDVDAGGAALQLDRLVDWAAGDALGLGTTDWYPSHTERVVVSSVAACTNCASTCPAGNGQCSDVTLSAAVAYAHKGTLTPVPAQLTNSNHGNPNDAIDTRAAVGLLSRDITIYSLGETAQDDFPAAKNCRLQDQFAGGTYSAAADPSDPGCFFGGHVIVRQGFGAFEVQGVEFHQLGQGGRMGHYPVHFHLAKDTSYTDAYLRDSSLWDSNTRYAVLHGTHGVELSRNVGHLSLGHGFYLEDGAEIDNALCYNLGVSSRASLVEYFTARGAADDCDPMQSGDGSPDCRYVPPILDGSFNPANLADKFTRPPSGIAGTTLPEGSDSLFPVPFWTMNVYNDLVGNKAVGVHGFGSCFWLLGSGVSGASKFLTWASEWQNSGGALIQTKGSGTSADYANYNLAGKLQSPVKSFRGNACSTAAYALQTTLQIPPTDANNSGVTAVQNPYIRSVSTGAEGSSDGAFHRSRINGNFVPLRYPDLSGGTPEVANCFQGLPAGQESQFATNATYCIGTVIDHFQASHNWSEVNFGSIWLRPQFFLFTNGKVSDQLYGGLGFVSGGSWSQVPPGYFTLTQNGLFAGTTQPDSADGGPTGPTYLLNDSHCANGGVCCATGQCILPDEGIGLFTQGFNPKRLITIYDGPFFGDGNIFFDIESFACDPILDSPNSCGIYLSTFQPGCKTGSCTAADYPYSQGSPGEMVVANAAVGWKQTNGFYYPPVFGFRKTAFDIPETSDPLSMRHVVIDQYQPYLRNYATNPVSGALEEWNPLVEGFPNSITPIDFSTIINDLDGTFNGLVVEDSTGAPLSTRTVAVSENRFFDAPAQTYSNIPGSPVNAGQECESFGSRTSAYEFVTTVVGKAMSPSAGEWYVDFDAWNTQPFPAVPIYRQLLMPGEQGSCASNHGNICSGTTQACDRGTFMSGAQAGQAPYLTMNRGIYYIDTSGTSFQDVSCVRNSPQFYLPIFDAGSSYVVWQLFAKDDTKVAYQLYVGESFDPTTDLTWVRVNPHVQDPSGSGNDIELVPATGGARYGGYQFDKCDGVLEIFLDNQSVADDFAIAERDANIQCMPRDLCTYELEHEKDPSSGRCVTSLPMTDPLHAQVDEACKSWVTATAGTSQATDASLGDLSLADCPEGGCIGFMVKLPSDFTPASYADKGAAYAGCFGTNPAATNDIGPDDFWNTPLAALTGSGITNNCTVPPAPLFCTTAPTHTCAAGCCSGVKDVFSDDFESGDTTAWVEFQ